MKTNYNPNRLSKRQRHMKKWIPDYIYCEGIGVGKHKNPCPFWHCIWNEYMDNKTYKHKRSECQFADGCNEDCSQCTEEVTYCEFLNYIEYGPFPLGDMCKICGIHEKELNI